MFKKESIKDFFNFKSLITESILKYLFIGCAALGALSAVIAILASWYGAVNMIRYNFGIFLLTLVGSPVLAVIGLAIYLVFLRLTFESVLIRFLTYRELKQINEKVKD